MSKKLSIKDIEKLENTSPASALAGIAEGLQDVAADTGSSSCCCDCGNTCADAFARLVLPTE